MCLAYQENECHKIATLLESPPPSRGFENEPAQGVDTEKEMTEELWLTSFGF
jgi:hypothetical protein